MFHMINKRAHLVEVWCTLISLNLYFFQNYFASPRGPKWVLFRLKRFLLEALPLGSSNYTCIMLFLASIRYQQNHRRKVIGRLYVCSGTLDILKFDKNPLIYSVLLFNLGVWKFVWWGLSPPKPLVVTELCQKTLISRQTPGYFSTLDLTHIFEETFHQFAHSTCVFLG